MDFDYDTAPAVSIDDIAVGDLVSDGTCTLAGDLNVFVVESISLYEHGDRLGEPRGIYGHFVNTDDTSQKRLPCDHSFFVWDFDFAHRSIRRFDAQSAAA